jgi:hypothetical protein
MNGSPTAAVAAVVLGAGGGDRLARTLASVAWAAERVVLDPARRLGGSPLPPGARYDAAPDPGQATAAAWILLLAEGETVPDALRDAIVAAVRGAPPAAAWRIGLDVGVMDGTLRPGRAPIRLAARGAGLRVRRDAGVELRAAGAGRPIGRLDPPIAVGWAGDLATAVVDLDADTAALAAVLDATAARPSAANLVAGGLAAAAAVLVARAPRPRHAPDTPDAAAPRGLKRAVRWAAAVLAGYRVAVAHAKLWESRRRVRGAVA